jgi:hypothetical protein
VSASESDSFPPCLKLITLCAFCCRLTPWDSYATFCKEQNIQRVQEPDRMDITKCCCCLLVSLHDHCLTRGRRYLMGVENFQQIKQVGPYPICVICCVLMRRGSLRPAMPLSKASYSFHALAFHTDALAAVARRQRAADPSQQDIPVDEATAAARAVRNASLLFAISFSFFHEAFATGVERSSAATLGTKRQSKRIRQATGCRRRLEGAPLVLRACVLFFQSHNSVLLQECEPLFAASKNVAQNITQNEKRTPDPSTWGCIPGCNFQSTVLKWFKAAKDESERIEREPKRLRVDAAAGGGAQKKAASPKDPPIILLPGSDSAILNMRNALEFFEKGVFVSEPGGTSQLAPKEFNVTCDTISAPLFAPAAAFYRPKCPLLCLIFFVLRRYNGSVFTFKAMSSCTRTEWHQRVVAVVAMGNTWQVCRSMSLIPLPGNLILFPPVQGFS